MRAMFAIVVAGACLLAGVPAWAHHAFAAEFDAKRPVHFEGKVTKVELINPHSWIHVDVKAADGTVQNWMFEAGSPNVLLRRGFNKNTIAIGTDGRHRRLPVQGRFAASQRPRHHAAQRTEAVPRLLGHRRAG